MKADIFVSRASNLFAENRLLRFALVVLTVAIIFNSFMVYRAVKYQRVVLIPPKMTGTVEFIKGRPTDQYIKDISRRIINLAATYSPATARAQFDELLTYYAPESYPVAQKEWYSLASRVEDSVVSSVFYLESIKLKKDSSLEIFGNQRQYATDTLLENGGKTYSVKYRLQDGRFYIVSLKEKVTEAQQQKEAGTKK